MSLMQLLSVGRSLCGINDEPSRYKMTQANLLPRFGSAKESGKNDASPELARSTRLMGGNPKKAEARPSLNKDKEKINPHLKMEKPDLPARPVPVNKPAPQAF